MEKAFDNLNWNFLLKVLEKKGFQNKWISWIKKCISSASFAILVNSAAGEFFKSSKAVRLRETLSPFFFIIAVNILSLMIERACSHGFLNGP